MVSVYLFVQNIIDYMRFITLCVSLYFHDSDPIKFVVFYFLSFSFDLFDGMAARYFNQCSRFGSALDMITDRLSTASLLIILSKYYPNYFLLFVSLVCLDVGSHWMQIFSSLLMIIKDPTIVNHKAIKEKFLILDLYYHNRFVLFNTCLWAEVFLLLLYLQKHFKIEHTPYYNYFYYFCMGIYTFKQICSIFQFFGASDRVVDLDTLERNEKLKSK